MMLNTDGTVQMVTRLSEGEAYADAAADSRLRPLLDVVVTAWVMARRGHLPDYPIDVLFLAHSLEKVLAAEGAVRLVLDGRGAELDWG